MPIIIRHDAPALLGKAAYQASYAQTLAAEEQRRAEERRIEQQLAHERAMRQIEQMRASREAGRQRVDEFLHGVGGVESQTPASMEYGPGPAATGATTISRVPAPLQAPEPAQDQATSRDTALQALNELARQRPGMEENPIYQVAVATVANGGKLTEEMIRGLGISTPTATLEGAGQPLAGDGEPGQASQVSRGGLDVPTPMEGTAGERTTSNVIETGQWGEAGKVWNERPSGSIDPNAPLTNRALTFRSQFQRAVESATTPEQLSATLAAMRKSQAPAAMQRMVEEKLQELERERFESQASGIDAAIQENTQALLGRTQRQLGRPLTLTESSKLQARVLEETFKAIGWTAEDIPRYRQWLQAQREQERQLLMQQAQEIRQAKDQARQAQLEETLLQTKQTGGGKNGTQGSSGGGSRGQLPRPGGRSMM